MASIISERFLLVVNKMIKNGQFKSARKFCQSIDYLPQSLSEVVKGRRDVPSDVLMRVIEKYLVNPVFLFKGEGDMFLDQDSPLAFKTLTVVTDKNNEERIVHVPVSAQAGYADSLNDVVMMEDLPTYTMPHLAFQSGTFRSFDVKGDSMEPSIEAGDILVCKYVDPDMWQSAIRDHPIYVIVTRTEVVVKRVMNNLRKHKHLELHSDNQAFPMFRVMGYDIQEVWYVHSTIKLFDHSGQPSKLHVQQDQIDALLDTIKAQADLIAQLRNQSNSL